MFWNWDIHKSKFFHIQNVLFDGRSETKTFQNRTPLPRCLDSRTSFKKFQNVPVPKRPPSFSLTHSYLAKCLFPCQLINPCPKTLFSSHLLSPQLLLPRLLSIRLFHNQRHLHSNESIHSSRYIHQTLRRWIPQISLFLNVDHNGRTYCGERDQEDHWGVE